jgi:hypothetical protein
MKNYGKLHFSAHGYDLIKYYLANAIHAYKKMAIAYLTQMINDR